MTITRESLERGKQPESVADYIGQAIGAATTIPYGPGVDEPFDSDSATAIFDWCLAGIARIDPKASEPPTTESLIELARSTGDVRAWAQAWVMTIQANPQLLNLTSWDETESWMVTWFANVQESCRHNRATAKAAFDEFMVREAGRVAQ